MAILLDENLAKEKCIRTSYQDYVKFCAEMAYNQTIFECTLLQSDDMVELSEGIGDKFKQVWASFKSWIGSVLKRIKAFFKKAKEKIMGLFKKKKKTEDKAEKKEEPKKETYSTHYRYDKMYNVLEKTKNSSFLNKKIDETSIDYCIMHLNTFCLSMNDGMVGDGFAPTYDTIKDNTKNLVDEFKTKMEEATEQIKNGNNDMATIESALYQLNPEVGDYKQGDTFFNKISSLISQEEVPDDKSKEFDKAQSNILEKAGSKISSLLFNEKQNVGEIASSLNKLSVEKMCKQLDDVLSKISNKTVHFPEGRDSNEIMSEITKIFDSMKKAIGEDFKGIIQYLNFHMKVVAHMVISLEDLQLLVLKHQQKLAFKS